MPHDWHHISEAPCRYTVPCVRQLPSVCTHHSGFCSFAFINITNKASGLWSRVGVVQVSLIHRCRCSFSFHIYATCLPESRHLEFMTHADDKLNPKRLSAFWKAKADADPGAVRVM